MEENIAHAFLNKGLFIEAVDYFDRSSINRCKKVQKTYCLPRTALEVLIIKTQPPIEEFDRLCAPSKSLCL